MIFNNSHRARLIHLLLRWSGRQSSTHFGQGPANRLPCASFSISASLLESQDNGNLAPRHPRSNQSDPSSCPTIFGLRMLASVSQFCAWALWESGNAKQRACLWYWMMEWWFPFSQLPVLLWSCQKSISYRFHKHWHSCRPQGLSLVMKISSSSWKSWQQASFLRSLFKSCFEVSPHFLWLKYQECSF